MSWVQLLVACSAPALFASQSDTESSSVHEATHREDLETALSAYHEAPAFENLQKSVPNLTDHLQTLTTSHDVNPLARSRAWQLLAQAPNAAPQVQQILDERTLSDALRVQILYAFAGAHPEAANSLLTKVWCDPSPLIRKAARDIDHDLEAPDCDESG